MPENKYRDNCPNQYRINDSQPRTMSILHATHTNKTHRRTVPHHLASAVIGLDAHCRLIETMHRSVTVYDGNHDFISPIPSTITRIASNSNHERTPMITRSSLTLSQLFLRFFNCDQWLNLFPVTLLHSNIA